MQNVTYHLIDFQMIYNSKGISPLEAKQLEDKAKSALAEVTGTTLSPQAALSPEGIYIVAF